MKESTNADKKLAKAEDSNEVEGYRTIVVLVEKTRSNLLALKRLSVEKKLKIPCFYRRDLELAESSSQSPSTQG